ncbi:hypothetical protein F3Y22_tig00111427pilonHSYRG00010 [Hibiscus syriacus]|uniref:beta-fructofuranosidase n=1 Tax=Hibiscus syriacus TaxID=106335 RepID=A0A6A2YII6_HIBSY|nr:hypothetical protein F3Y22_tig00111427pilonHSYRG00010 [Hibiscus syriacus]
MEDLEQNSAFHAPLLHRPSAATRPLKGFAVVIFLLTLIVIMTNHLPNTEPSASATLQPRGVAEGVSAKSNPSLLNQAPFNWTNAMFSWQRSAYHFQPQKNWMNDPNGKFLILCCLL